jgi:L-serine dehydratase
MAAGELCEVLGGAPAQVERPPRSASAQARLHLRPGRGAGADPIHRAHASLTAISAARLALAGAGSHKVSLDKAIKTMRNTGRDMKVKYKETRGSLAVYLIEC